MDFALLYPGNHERQVCDSFFKGQQSHLRMFFGENIVCRILNFADASRDRQGEEQLDPGAIIQVAAFNHLSSLYMQPKCRISMVEADLDFQAGNHRRYQAKSRENRFFLLLHRLRITRSDGLKLFDRSPSLTLHEPPTIQMATAQVCELIYRGRAPITSTATDPTGIHQLSVHARIVLFTTFACLRAGNALRLWDATYGRMPISPTPF